MHPPGLHAQPRTAERRRRLRRGLEAWIPAGAEVALLDVPVHRNVGDLFILTATERYLDSRGCAVVYRAGRRDYRTVRARRVVSPDTLLVCLGGGNFGDLYPDHQRLRERVIRDFPTHAVVVLPQSVHFRDPARLDRSAMLFREHGQVRMAVRDRRSLDLVRHTFTGAVRILPDMVHWFEERIPRSDTATEHRAVALLRRDREAVASRQVPDGIPTMDWPDLLPGLKASAGLGAILLSVAPPALTHRIHAWWSRQAELRFEQALARLAAAESVITDRLHGAIVARLASRPVTLLDNSYGKLSHYYDTWWRDDLGVRLHRARESS